MANTRETMGEQACLDALVANTMTSFEDDGVTKVGANCLRFHTALTDVKLPQCKSVESYGLADCTALTTVDMQGTGTISANAFDGDTALAHLILRGGSMTTLVNTGALANTAIARGLGAVYVKPDMLATYEADSIWNSYRLATLSEYPITDFSTIEDSWSTIISKAQDGTASQSYSIGDTKLLDLGTEGKVYAQIVGFGVDALASDNTQFAGITFVAMDALDNKRVWEDDITTSRGWIDSSTRAYLNETLFALFPSEVASAVKEVKKYSSSLQSASAGTVSNNVISEDKIWVPSAHEVGLSGETSGPRYGMFGANSDRIKFCDGKVTIWKTRSLSDKSNVKSVSTAGASTIAGRTTNSSVVIGFCI